MGAFILHHRHEPQECAIAFAAWKAFESPLRRGVALSSCRRGGHEIFWTVEARDADAALGLLPRYVALRTTAVPVEEVAVP